MQTNLKHFNSSSSCNLRPTSTTPNIVQKFGLKPYRFSTLHELKGTDSPKRLTFCAWFEQFIHLFDESRFHLLPGNQSEHSPIFFFLFSIK